MIELKHLAAHLPWGVKGISSQWQSNEIQTLTGVYSFCDVLTDKDEYCMEYFKPILHPLTSLTKPITHKGEIFVPIEKLKEIYPNIDNARYLLKNDYWLTKNLADSIIEYCIIEKLLEWHFNVFNLPSDCFVEVTDEFNPYA